MLEALLTLIVLSSSPSGSADSIAPGSQNYGLELAFEQAQVDSMDASSAIPLELLHADERIDEAVHARGNGDKAGEDLAMDGYSVSLEVLADDVMSADGLNDDEMIAELDERLTGHDRKAKGLQDEGDDGTAEEGEDSDAGACTRDDHPVATRISEAFGMSYDQVMAMFCAE